MAINYSPSDLVSKMAPKKVIEKLINKDLTLNRTALSMLARSGLASKKKLEQVALKVLKGYRNRFKAEVLSGASKTAARAEAIAEAALMVQRVQSEIIFEVSKEIRRIYKGEIYVWLPSDAEEPDPEHQLLYGKKRRVGVGEMPGERYGCKCGMRILVDEDELDLDDDES